MNSVIYPSLDRHMVHITSARESLSHLREGKGAGCQPAAILSRQGWPLKLMSLTSLKLFWLKHLFHSKSPSLPYCNSEHQKPLQRKEWVSSQPSINIQHVRTNFFVNNCLQHFPFFSFISSSSITGS